MGHAAAILGVALALAAPVADALELRLSRSLSPAHPVRSSAPFPRATTQLVVALSVNAVDRGDKLARITETGELLLKAEDFRELQPLPPEVAIYAIEGQEYVALGDLPGAKVAFDERNLALELRLPAAGFAAQVRDLASEHVALDVSGAPASVLFNYRLDYGGIEGQGATLGLASELAVAYGGWLLRNESTQSRSERETRSLRLETQAIRDDRANLRRLTLGDAFTPAVALGSGVPLAGITFAKAYALDPAFVAQPVLAFRGMAETPSQVDLYVGDLLVSRQRVGPGPFELQNFRYNVGRRDVRVVVRDAFGHETTLQYPFYFAPEGLAAGLHDYSYQAGWLREGMATPDDRYGPAALSAFHRYGVDGRWTLGARLEAMSARGNGGPEVLLRTDRYGIFAAHASWSRDRETQRGGHAVSLAHSLQWGELTSQASYVAFSDGYAALHAGAAPKLPRRDLNLVVGYSRPALGSLTAGYEDLVAADLANTRAVSLGYSRPFARDFSLLATLRRVMGEGYEGFVGLQYRPRPDTTVNVSYHRDAKGASAESLSVGNEQPRGEGWAYSIGAQRATGEGGGRTVAPHVEYQGRHGTLAVDASSVTTPGAGAVHAYDVSWSGALGAIGGRVFASRPIADSFAVVEIEPALEGIRVYQNSQEVGRTDARGRILLPDLAAYATSFASIQDKDVPIEYSIGRAVQSFSPAYRAGALVSFGVARIRGFAGTLAYTREGVRKPLEFALATARVGTGTVEIPTARGGEFYVENLPAGRVSASVEIGGSPCEFFIDVPPSDAPLTPLGEVLTCDVHP